MSLVIKFEAGLRPVIKHQEHDQASHGSWATGTADPSLISIDTQIAFNEGAIKATDNILSPSAYKSQLDGNLNRTYPKTYLEEAVNNPAYQDALQTHLKSIGFPETVKVFSSSAQEGEYFHGSVAPLWDSGAVGYESEESPKEFSVNRSDIIGLGKVADSGVWFRNTKAVQKHQEHDQSSHGNWATGQKGGSGLSHREMFELKKQPDPMVRKVYEAEEKNHNQIQDKNADMPSAPNRTQFTNYADYDKAYKQYSKDFTAWSKKVTTSLISPLGQKHLDGTPRGVNGYVRDVLRQDWFVEAFGKGGVAGNNLEVKVSSANEAGAYQIGFKGDLPVSILRVSRGYSKAEPTIVHEIAHYATTISATSPHGGHGVEFARNHIFITSKLFGASFADGLEKSYREAGVPLGD
jgi:hypothetical protein